MTGPIAGPNTGHAASPDTDRNAPNAALVSDVAAGVTTGVTGQRWRATITPWGDIHPWAGAADGRPIRWFVAADDRWHVPAEETAVRQHRVEGTPVVETRLRVPDGDAVQRVWSVADGGGLTVIEIENDSSRPFAVAFSGGGIVTERPPAAVPIQGIDLDADTIVVPVGHRSSVRVAIAHTPGAGTPARLMGAAPSTAVVSGWLNVCDRPQPLRAARCIAGGGDRVGSQRPAARGAGRSGNRPARLPVRRGAADAARRRRRCMVARDRRAGRPNRSPARPAGRRCARRTRTSRPACRRPPGGG